MINKNTKVYISIGSKPGNFGTKIYGILFNYFRINSIYKSFKIRNIKNLILSVKSLNINGFSVAMPFKEKVIKYLFKVEESAKNIGAVNTVILKKKKLYGYNTDLNGIIQSIKYLKIKKSAKILVVGSGGTAKTSIYALNNVFKFKNIFFISRNKRKNLIIAKNYKVINISNFNDNKNFDLLINCTPLGMDGMKNKLPVPVKILQTSKYIIDFVNKPAETKFIKLARKYNIKYVSGNFISLNQIIKQFYIYTGQKISYQKLLKITNENEEKNNNKKKLLKYFKYFEKKDTEKLSTMLANNIILKDWNNSVKGIFHVINFNKKIFKDLKYIKIKINNIYSSNNTFFVELVLISKKIKIKILDKIRFNNLGKIMEITAYKM